MSKILLTIILINACNIKPVEQPKEKAYSEQHRPQFHFTPPSQWMNDPNGMFYLNGKFFLLKSM